VKDLLTNVGSGGGAAAAAAPAAGGAGGAEAPAAAKEEEKKEGTLQGPLILFLLEDLLLTDWFFLFSQRRKSLTRTWDSACSTKRLRLRFSPFLQPLPHMYSYITTDKMAQPAALADSGCLTFFHSESPPVVWDASRFSDIG
jgi:hypothetical protein